MHTHLCIYVICVRGCVCVCMCMCVCVCTCKCVCILFKPKLTNLILSIYPSLFVSIYLSIYLSIDLSLFVSIYLSLSVYSYLSLSFFLSFFLIRIIIWLLFSCISIIHIRLTHKYEHKCYFLKHSVRKYFFRNQILYEYIFRKSFLA